MLKSVKSTFAITAAMILSFAQVSVAANVAGVVEHSDPNQVSQAGGAGTEITVTVNTPTDHISHNTYTYFNVPDYGVTLDNSAAGARTIINEVTSTGSQYRSMMEGPLTVSGSRAHVIVANPNGMTVNGGSFVNTSSILLSTGDILTAQNVNIPVSGSDTFLNDPYYVIKTETGDILVNSEGFSGAFPRLDLISKSLAITGPNISTVTSVLNANIGTTTTILRDGNDVPLPTIAQDQPIYHQVVAGACSTSGSNTDCTGTTAASYSGSSYVVDITGLTSINAGAINLTINDTGAGFRFAGVEMGAEDGQITITTSGEILIDATNGGQVTAERDLAIDSNDYDITFDGLSTKTNTLTSGEDLSIDAGTGDIINNGYTLQSQIPDDTTNTLNGGVTIDANNLYNRSLSGTALAIIYSSSGKVSSRDLTVVNSGGGVYSLDNRETGGITITTAGDIYNESGRIVSNNGVTVNVGGDLYNRVLRDGGGSNTASVTHSTRTNSFLFFRADRKVVTYDYGALEIPGQAAYIQAARGDVQLNFTASGASGNLYNIGGEINADGGMDYVLASTSIDNSGNDSTAAGGAGDTMTLTNTSTGDSYVYTVTGTETSNGNGFNNGQELLVKFVEGLNSHKANSGQFTDLKEYEVIQVSELADADDAFGLVFGSEQADQYTFTYNDASSGSDAATLQTSQSDGSVYIGTSSTAANNVNAVHNQAVLNGKSEYHTTCFLYCDRRGSTTLVATGGLISAQNQLAITVDGGAANASYNPQDLSVNTVLTGADQTIGASVDPDAGYIVNLGGRLTALNKNEDNSNNAIDIQSASSNVNIIAEAQRLQMAMVRQQGMFAHGHAKIIAQDQGGSFTANMGRLNFTNLGDIRIIGGSLSGGTSGEDIYSGGTQTDMDTLDPDRTYPVAESGNFNGNIGITNGFLTLF